MKPREYYMRRAIELARRAEGKTLPNPIVGAVLVDNQGNIKAEGYHKKAGGPHAEVECLSNINQADPSDILYVTLEPCCIHGKTPPCTDLILKKKVKHVMIGTIDPNPLVSGKGVQVLRNLGVQVSVGLLKKECEEMNEFFNRLIVKKVPYVAVKSAITLDGKIATRTGESKWITSKDARNFGQELRSRYQAIGIGKNTLIADNPRLTDRSSVFPKDPKRVLFTSDLKHHQNFHFYESDHSDRIIIVGKSADSKSLKNLEKKGFRIIIDQENESPNVETTLKELYNNNIYSILIEGGGKLISSLMAEDLVDKIYLFIAPKVIGQSEAPSWVSDYGLQNLSEAKNFKIEETKFFQNDFLMTLKR